MKHKFIKGHNKKTEVSAILLEQDETYKIQDTITMSLVKFKLKKKKGKKKSFY